VKKKEITYDLEHIGTASISVEEDGMPRYVKFRLANAAEIMLSVGELEILQGIIKGMRADVQAMRLAKGNAGK
jgi:hypothetical protein